MFAFTKMSAFEKAVIQAAQLQKAQRDNEVKFFDIEKDIKRFLAEKRISKKCADKALEVLNA